MFPVHWKYVLLLPSQQMTAKNIFFKTRPFKTGKWTTGNAVTNYLRSVEMFSASIIIL